MAWVLQILTLGVDVRVKGKRQEEKVKKYRKHEKIGLYVYTKNSKKRSYIRGLPSLETEKTSNYVGFVVPVLHYLLVKNNLFTYLDPTQVIFL